MSAQMLERNEESRSETRDDLHAAVRARQVANMRYQQALIKAREEGWNNTQIARAVGVSEAAIRLYWIRHPQLEAGIQVITGLKAG
jgi:DNA-directed RNA polymerase specialized sigma24 family protein